MSELGESGEPGEKEGTGLNGVDVALQRRLLSGKEQQRARERRGWVLLEGNKLRKEGGKGAKDALRRKRGKYEERLSSRREELRAA